MLTHKVKDNDSSSLTGAKHSPPRDKFQKSGGPRARGPKPSEMQISEIKLYPNEEFSTATLMIFNVDSNCVHPRFQFRVYMWARVNISENNIGHGSKHSPPGHKFEKSEGPPVAVVDTPFHKVFFFQIVSKCIILDFYPHDSQRRFQLYPSQVLNPSAHDGEPPQFSIILRILRKVSS